MAADPVFPLLRMVLYVDLMLLAGLSGIVLSAWPRAAAWRPFFVSLILAGLLAAVAHMGASIGGMMGQPVRQVELAITRSIIAETSPGWAFGIRIAALALALLIMLLPGWSARRVPVLAIVAALALGTLAWSGHAAATEGWVGTAHRLADAAHLVAAAWWVGALLAFAVAAWLPADRLHRELAAALAWFSGLGTAFVLVIVITGIINVGFVVGFYQLWAALTQTYGMLLLVKLALFGGMLVLAGRNRWVLAPALAHAGESSGERLMRRLRFSLTLELVLGISVIAVVARLGVLAPLPD